MGLIRVQIRIVLGFWDKRTKSWERFSHVAAFLEKGVSQDNIKTCIENAKLLYCNNQRLDYPVPLNYAKL